MVVMVTLTSRLVMVMRVLVSSLPHHHVVHREQHHHPDEDDEAEADVLGRLVPHPAAGGAVERRPLHHAVAVPAGGDRAARGVGCGDGGAGRLHGLAAAGDPVLVVAAHAHARSTLAGAGVFLPLPLEIRGAGGLEAGELGLAAAETGGLVEDLVVVAVGDGALAAAGAAVLLDGDGGAELGGGAGVGADDDVDLVVALLLRGALAAGAFQAEAWKKLRSLSLGVVKGKLMTID